MSEKQGRNGGIRVLEEFICEAVPEIIPPGTVFHKRSPRKLFVVERVSTVEKHGTVLAPGLIPQSNENFRIGSEILLRRPDGTELRVSIGGLDYFHPGPKGEWLVLVNLMESDVPIGTEVWST